MISKYCITLYPLSTQYYIITGFYFCCCLHEVVNLSVPELHCPHVRMTWCLDTGSALRQVTRQWSWSWIRPGSHPTPISESQSGAGERSKGSCSELRLDQWDTWARGTYHTWQTRHTCPSPSTYTVTSCSSQQWHTVARLTTCGSCHSSGDLARTFMAGSDSGE